jgi:hypothetical protein
VKSHWQHAWKSPERDNASHHKSKHWHHAHEREKLDCLWCASDTTTGHWFQDALTLDPSLFSILGVFLVFFFGKAGWAGNCVAFEVV